MAQKGIASMSALVEMKQISKIYPNGVVANKGVDFAVEKGEIHALEWW